MTRWQGRIPLLVGVAGQRQLDPDGATRIEREARAFFAELRARLPATPIVVLSRLAHGADQLAVSAALAAGCESACVLPPEVAGYHAALGGETGRGGFERLLAASTVVTLPVGPVGGSDPESVYATAGYYLARHATILLALWDGAESQRRGSVGDVVRRRLAGRTGPSDPTLCQLRVGRREDCAARAPEHAARAALEACGCRSTEVFNAALLAAARPELDSTPEPFAAVPDERVGDVAAAFRAASLSAAEVRGALTRRKALMQGIAFLAAIAFAVYLKFGAQTWVLWTYLGLLASALLVRMRLRHRELHRRYLDYRCLAEGLRVALYLRIAGALGEGQAESPAAHILGGADPSRGWIESAIAALDGWMGRAALPAGFDGLGFARRHWLGAEAGSDPHAQVAYYHGAARHLRRIAARIDRVVNLTLITGVASAALLALLPAGWLGRAVPILTTVMGFMPLVSSTASTAVDVPAQQEIARQYEYMGRLLTHAARRLDAAGSDQERRRILFEAGVAALAEQRVWHAVIGQRAPERRVHG